MQTLYISTRDLPTQIVETTYRSLKQSLSVSICKIKTQFDFSLVTVSYAFYEETESKIK